VGQVPAAAVREAERQVQQLQGAVSHEMRSDTVRDAGILIGSAAEQITRARIGTSNMCGSVSVSCCCCC
jgi:hypothetical protein